MSLCPCTSGLEFEDCCGPIIDGTKKAPTAEALMRSRYTAYCVKNIDHVEKTHAPGGEDDFDRAVAEDMANNVNWVGLKIGRKTGGEEGDSEGTVEFWAQYKHEGMLQGHHEISSFKRINGEWLYIDGILNPPVEQRRVEKVGRNDPCTCGSGKKYKKCCGAN